MAHEAAEVFDLSSSGEDEGQNNAAALSGVERELRQARQGVATVAAPPPLPWRACDASCCTLR